ncbi:unnamed protein product, partial [Symbiodinium sp. CCMP2456]
MDEDDDVRSLGAERDYYSTLEPPILPMNGPISTLEQLLQVKGVTPELLWGLDQDRNYEVSPAEAAGVALPVDNSTGELSGGWASMLTLYSAEANVQPDGTPKINVNGDDLQQLHTQIESVLGIDAANFVVAYRQGGPEEDPDALEDEATEPEQPEEVEALGEGGGEGGGSTQMQEKAAGAITIDFNAPAAEAITDPLDLVGVRVRVVEAGQLEPAIVTSPWQEGDTTINQMVSTLTTTDATSIPGRVNINQAPRAVLIGLPGMPPNVADAIVANRDPTAGSTRPDRLNAVWLLTEGYLQLEEMKALAPYVTGQGAVYRTQVVGGYEAGGPIRRMEVVLDATTLPPRVVLRRDLSPLGAGFDPALSQLSPRSSPALLTLALQTDSRGVTAVLADRPKGGSVRLAGYATVERAPSADKLAEALRAALPKLRGGKAQLAVALGPEDVRVKRLAVPPAPETELPPIVALQAARDAAADVESIVADFSPPQAGQEGAPTVLAAWASEEALAFWREVAEDLGGRLAVATPRPLAI